MIICDGLDKALQVRKIKKAKKNGKKKEQEDMRDRIVQEMQERG